MGIASTEQVWLTFDNALSRQLLQDREVAFIPYVAPRSLLGAWRVSRTVEDLIAEHQFDLAVSTGAIPAVATLPLAARRGIAAHYVESAARATRPSLSGRIVSTDRRVNTYCQYPSWANSRWLYRGSIYDGYQPALTRHPIATIRSAVVTVGTTEGYVFDRLFERLAPLLRGCDWVLWQTGTQDTSAFGISSRKTVPHDELQAAMAEADVVVAHSGTGSALSAFDVGKHPLLVPRRARYKEHVDDHQIQIGQEFERRGLALLREADAITLDDLLQAAERRVDKIPPPPFDLVD